MEGANPEEGAPAPAANGRRILLALGALVLFGAVVAIVAVTAGGDDESGASAAAAPRECVEAWNGDREAVAYARHNSIFHNYTAAQVGYLTASADAAVSGDPGSGDCAVVFPRNQLDPEPEAAGQILRDGIWTPLIRVAQVNTVARLQSEAFEGANAEPTIDGKIVAADGAESR